MKRFMVFAGDSYYPEGGMADFLGDYETIEEAITAVTATVGDWSQIVDTLDRRWMWDLETQKNWYEAPGWKKF